MAAKQTRGDVTKTTPRQLENILTINLQKLHLRILTI